MKRRFQTFDALRFLAFLKVFLLHLPIVAFPLFNFLKKGGGIGVVFFFVLSGFLISYIIIEEKARCGKLDLLNFYVRRILRIWPLYFLMVGFAFATPFILNVLNLSYSNDGYNPNWLVSLTFLENYKIIITHSNPNISPLGVMWSLCIEEHFYIIWGVIMFFIKIERIPLLIITSIIVSFISNIVFIHLNIYTSELLTNLIFFAFGAIPAYLLVLKQEKFDIFILNISLFYRLILVGLIIAYVILSPNIVYPCKIYLEPLLFGILFCIIICLIIPQEGNSLKISDSNIISKFGILTYGLYLYHTIVLNFYIQIFKIFKLLLSRPFNAVLFILISFVTTLLISIISYKLFEKPFLKLKVYFYK